MDRPTYVGLPGATEGNYIQYDVDPLDRVTSTRLYGPGNVLRNEHDYQLNAANQRTRQTFNDGNPSGNTHLTDYTYDKIGQLKTAKGTDHAFNYSTYSYVDTPRLQEQSGYAYDAAGNLNRRTNNALVQTFGVNTLNELTNATRSGTLTVAGLASERKSLYAGDYGITNVTVSGTGLTTGNATVYADGSWARSGATLADGNNTYTATATDTYGRTAADTINLSLPSTINFQYDFNGNLTNDGRRVFEYDYENQLTNVYVASAWRSAFQYDAFGRRKIRREYTWNGSSWTQTNEVRYVYDGMLVVQERDANNLASVSYTRGNDLSHSLQGAGGIGGLLARTDHGRMIAGDPSAHAYYHCDGNGNITALVDTNGIIVARYQYDPYGNLLGMSGPMAEANTYRFSSKEWCANSGLYYYGFRYYEPNLQRWINRDPIAEEGGVNLYSYVFNNSVNFLDRLGLAIVFVPHDWQGPPTPGDTIVHCPSEPSGASVQQNMTTAESLGFKNSSPFLGDNSDPGFGSLAGSAVWFYNQVKKGAPWDYKQINPLYEDFGNFNYGAAGSAFGWDPWTLQNEAGIAQQKDPDSRGVGRGVPGSRWKSGSGALV